MVLKMVMIEISVLKTVVHSTVLGYNYVLLFNFRGKIMGYYVRLTDSSVVLKNENKAEILKIWKDLNKPENNHLKHGGSWSGGKQTEWWYSWMDSDYDKKVYGPENVLEMMGFDFHVEDNGDVHVTNYDSKTGSELLFFSRIAQFIEAGQTMSWSGEDGASFMWVFNGSNMKEMSGREAMAALLEIGRQKDIEENKAKPQVANVKQKVFSTTKENQTQAVNAESETKVKKSRFKNIL
jgi:hypothetical protein